MADQTALTTPQSEPQLLMRRHNLDGLPPLEVPEGYEIRAYRLGDEAAWARIMDTGLRLSDNADWTAKICREKLTGRPQFDPAGLFFATARGEAIGSACAWVRSPGETQVGYVHMVCVDPAHRGHRLGYWLTLAVLHRFVARGFREAELETDDFRLSAIQAYLELGFEPAYPHPSHAERWVRVLAALGERGQSYSESMRPVAIGPIGVVRNSVPTPIHEGWEEIVSEVVVEPTFAQCLDGIEGYSHLTVISWLSDVTAEQRQIRKLHPRDRAELPLMGVLATHSQYRPNPIGMTTVRLLSRRGNVLVVQGLDAIDGTPVLDLKPWSPRDEPQGPVVVPDWVAR